MDIHNKKIWLTGASSGIGEGLAKHFAEQGAELILSARNIEKLEQLKAALPNADKHTVVPLDIGEPELLYAKIESALATVGIPDILVNNAGISQRSTAKDTKLSVQRRVMEVNYFGTIAITQALLPQMITNGGGMIVNISSVAGKVGGQSMSGYSASKHAVIGYMDSLRAEEANNGIQVLNVCPGFVQTNISINAMDADGKKYDRMAASIKNGISVDECASAIINAIKKDKDEVVIGKGISGWAPTIYRFFPGLFRKLAARKNVR
jgi:dehydrogenase/reductase SDR family protein 7B